MVELVHPMELTQPKPQKQVDLRTMEAVRHLMWHKAMVSDDDDGSRINEYISLVQNSEDGEHVSIKDAFHRDLAIAFELVIQEHMDPWDLDLAKFARMYLEEARARGVDLVTSGRIILMAWTVLKLQSDEIAERAMARDNQMDDFGWDDLPDFSFTDDEWDYTERVQALPQAPIDEKIRHKGDRRVTLMELINAFEDIHEEADTRKKHVQMQLQARLSLKRKMRGKVGNMVHKEDLQADVEETWTRILEHPGERVPFSDLHEQERTDCVQTFNALLFLAKESRITVAQEEFPRGEIWIVPNLEEIPVDDIPETATMTKRRIHEDIAAPEAAQANQEATTESGIADETAGDSTDGVEATLAQEVTQ